MGKEISYFLLCCLITTKAILNIFRFSFQELLYPLKFIYFHGVRNINIYGNFVVMKIKSLKYHHIIIKFNDSIAGTNGCQPRAKY